MRLTTLMKSNFGVRSFQVFLIANKSSTVWSAAGISLNDSYSLGYGRYKITLSVPFDQTPISEPSALKYAFNCYCPFFSLGALTSTIIYGVILSFLYTIMSAALARISRPKWTLFSVSMRSNGYL